MKSTPVSRAVVALFLGVLAAGWVLPVWWWVSRTPLGVPGLGAFPSAYLGDTLLLPGSCLILAVGIRHLGRAARERIVVGSAAVAASAAAADVQRTWLADRAPRLNWTLTRPGHFTGAGWWHAVYFTAMSAILTGLVVCYLMRVRQSRRTAVNQAGSSGAVLLLTALGTYLGLVLHDNLSFRTTHASRSSLLLTAGALVVLALLLSLAYGGRVLVIRGPLTMSISGAVALTVLITSPLHHDAFSDVPGSAVVCVVAAVAIEVYLVLTELQSLRGRALLQSVLVAIVLLASWTRLVTPLATHAQKDILLVAVATFALMGGVFAGTLPAQARLRAFLPGTCAGLMLITIAASSEWFRAQHGGLGTGAAILKLLIPLIAAVSMFMIRDRVEKDLGVQGGTAEPGSRLTADRISRAHLVLALAACFALGGFLAVLGFTLSVLNSVSFPAGTSFGVADKRLLFIEVAALFLAGLLLVLTHLGRSSRLMSVASAAVRVALPVGLSSVLIFSMCSQRVGWWVTLVGVAMGFLMFLWTLISVTDNVWLLQGRPLKSDAAALSLLLAVFMGVNGAWIIIGGMRSDSQMRSPGQAVLIDLGALLFAGALVVVLGASSSIHKPHFTELPPWRGLLQDALCGSAIALLLVFPAIYLWNITGVGTGLVASASVVSFFTFPFLWIMKANRTHVQVEALRLLPANAEALLATMEVPAQQRFMMDQRELRKAFREPCPAESEQFIRVLAGHTRNQNRIAAAMILVPLAGAVALAISLTQDNGVHTRILAWLYEPPNSV